MWIYRYNLGTFAKIIEELLKKTVTITEVRRPMCGELLYKIYIMIGHGSNVMGNDV